MICSFPRQVDSQIFDDLYRRGKVELELVPQGNLAARGSGGRRRGWGGIYPHRLRHAAGGKAREMMGNRRSPLRAEYPIKADFLR